MPLKYLVFNPMNGAAGDMLAAALVDLGVPLPEMLRPLQPLVSRGWIEVRASPVRRSSIQATALEVEVCPPAPRLSLAEMAETARGLDLGRGPLATVELALSHLGRAEGFVHGQENGHLHELGSLDTLADAVMVAEGISLLEVAGAFTMPLTLGVGAAEMGHGRLPLPGPAVAALLAGSGIEVSLVPGPETVTPTGAALLLAATKRWEAGLPALQIARTGYGAGDRDDEKVANVCQALLLEAGESLVERVGVLEVYVDDLSPEYLGSLADEAVAEGAIDAYVSAAAGKKGRMGAEITVLCAERDVDRFLGWLHRRTKSPGVRFRVQSRSVLPRSTVTVEVEGYSIDIKVTPVGVKPEFEMVSSAASATGMTLFEVERRAIQAYLQLAAG